MTAKSIDPFLTLWQRRFAGRSVCGSINGRTVWQQKIDDFLTFWQSRQHSVENKSVVTSSGRGLFSALGRPVIYGFARYADMPSLGSKIQDLCFFTSTCSTSHGCCPSSLAMRPVDVAQCSVEVFLSILSTERLQHIDCKEVSEIECRWLQSIAIACNHLSIWDPRSKTPMASWILDLGSMNFTEISGPFAIDCNHLYNRSLNYRY